MLSVLLFITGITCIISGLTVLALGSWEKHMLKFAGIALSVTSAIFLSYIHITSQVDNLCMSSAICDQYALYGAVRNIAFIIFHIVCARDTIRLRQGERRHTA